MGQQRLDNRTAIGAIWHIADTPEEAQRWRAGYLAKGALEVTIAPHKDGSGRQDVVIRMERDRASDILGYPVEESEWLEEPAAA